MLSGVQTVYDVVYDLKGFAETGAFTLWYADVVYSVDISQRHSDHVVTATIKFKTLNKTPGMKPGQYKMIAKAYPDNGYTQLISKEVSVAKLVIRWKITFELNHICADETKARSPWRIAKVV